MPYSIPLWTIFTKWPAPAGPDSSPAFVRPGRQRLKNRREPFHHLRVAADHQAVAFCQPPDAAARARIHEIQLLRRQRRGAPHRVPVIRIPAVNDRVARRKMRRQQIDRLVHRRARRNHQPDRPRRLELRDQFLERINARRAFLDHAAHRRRVSIEPHDAMSAAHQPLHHEAAHLAQANHPQFHCSLLDSATPLPSLPIPPTPRATAPHPGTGSRASPSRARIPDSTRDRQSARIPPGRAA